MGAVGGDLRSGGFLVHDVQIVCVPAAWHCIEGDSVIRCPACSKRYSSDEAICPGCGFSPPVVDGFPAWAPDMVREGGGFKPEYFAMLAELEAANFWFCARNNLIIWAMRHYFPGFRTFLEVGCGTGFVLSGVAKAFPAAAIAGSEIFSAGLGIALNRVAAAQFMQMDGRNVPFEDEFDVLGAFDVLEHIPEDEDVLAGFYRAVHSGGGIIITVPQHPWLWSAADESACHVRRYTAPEIHSKVEAAGFHIQYSTSFVSLLLPAMLFSRVCRRTRGEFDPLSEFRIPSVVNRLFGGVMSLERYLIEKGVAFPLGGSRLVVASKL